MGLRPISRLLLKVNMKSKWYIPGLIVHDSSLHVASNFPKTKLFAFIIFYQNTMTFHFG